MLRFPVLPVMFCLCVQVVAQAKQATEKVNPIEADLVSTLKVPGVKPGDRVLAKLGKEWRYHGCTLPRGSVIGGTVKSATEAGAGKVKETQISLLFSVSCGELKDQALRWIALLGPEDLDLAGLHDGNRIAVQAFRSSTFGEGGVSTATTSQLSHPDMSGRQQPNFPVFVDPVKDTRIPRPIAVKTGEVWRIPELSLRVSEGPEKSSVLASKKKHLTVPSQSTIVLTLPSEEAGAATEKATVVAMAGTVPGRGAPTVPLPSEKIACDPAFCAVASAGTDDLGSDPRPVQTLSIAGLGYRRLRSAELQDFEYGAAVAFLGTDRLLFTFDPHTLIPRNTDDAPESAAHMVRGVIF